MARTFKPSTSNNSQLAICLIKSNISVWVSTSNSCLTWLITIFFNLLVFFRSGFIGATFTAIFTWHFIFPRRHKLLHAHRADNYSACVLPAFWMRMLMIPSQAAFIGAESFPTACWIGIEKPTAVRTNIHILIRANHIVLEPSSQIVCPLFLGRSFVGGTWSSQIAVSPHIDHHTSVEFLILRRNENFSIMQM